MLRNMSEFSSSLSSLLAANMLSWAKKKKINSQEIPLGKISFGGFFTVTLLHRVQPLFSVLDKKC